MKKINLRERINANYSWSEQCGISSNKTYEDYEEWAMEQLENGISQNFNNRYGEHTILSSILKEFSSAYGYVYTETNETNNFGDVNYRYTFSK